jgi:hypothetical protein
LQHGHITTIGRNGNKFLGRAIGVAYIALNAIPTFHVGIVRREGNSAVIRATLTYNLFLAH